MNAAPDLVFISNSFVKHLKDNKYVGPNTANSVGLTKNNLINIYNLVSKKIEFMLLLQSEQSRATSAENISQSHRTRLL